MSSINPSKQQAGFWANIDDWLWFNKQSVYLKTSGLMHYSATKFESSAQIPLEVAETEMTPQIRAIDTEAQGGDIKREECTTKNKVEPVPAFSTGMAIETTPSSQGLQLSKLGDEERGPAAWVKAYHVFCFLVAIYLVINSAVRWHWFSLRFLTVWGLYFTMATFAVTVYLDFRPRGSPNTLKGWNAAWKWRFYLFEVTITLETIITIFYWGVLYEPERFDGSNKYEHASTILNHGFPALVLYLEYLLTNQPFIGRHAAILFVIVVCYPISDIINVKVSDKLTYSVLTWDGGITSILTPVFTAVGGIAVFYAFVAIGRVKARLYCKRDHAASELFKLLDS